VHWFKVAAFLILGLAVTIPASLAQSEEKGPERFSVIEVEYTIYEWWLSNWSDNEVVCQLHIEHEGWPTADEVYWSCGKKVYKIWSETKACPDILEEGDVENCKGVYLSLVAETEAVRNVAIELPASSVWVSVSGCSPLPPENRCDSLPNLRLTGEEPLPNEYITNVRGSIDDVPFHCEAAQCDIPLRQTKASGVWVYFQADTSLGDSSKMYRAKVRVLPAPPSESNEAGWYVDVISTQWRGERLASCSQVWQSFPPPGGPPAWLSTPEDANELHTEEPYVYLAGVLIANGEVDALDCPRGGLLPNGGANVCGLERARYAATDWQNSFDEIILGVARSTGVPAQLMKNLFARESQFWPGLIQNVQEAGLGHLTANGADTTLLWNESFYKQFCPLVLNHEFCEKGYAHLDEDSQAMLRGALINRVNARCDTCPLGFDMSYIDYSVEVYAETLLANCAQIGQMIWNTSGDTPLSSSYEDLWRFTLLNYNTGPGCVSKAISKTWSKGRPLSWENVTDVLKPACTKGIEYVEEIAR
jgi:hypothetical protein